MNIMAAIGNIIPWRYNTQKYLGGVQYDVSTDFGSAIPGAYAYVYKCRYPRHSREGGNPVFAITTTSGFPPSRE